MQSLTLTYGAMPTREQYDAQYAGILGDDGFSFSNDPQIGTCVLSRNELWDEMQRASQHYQTLLAQDTTDDPEHIGSWLASVLLCLGIEWI